MKPDFPIPRTPDEYVEYVIQRAGSSLSSGLDFRPLAKFLRQGMPRNGSIPNNLSSRARFLTCYDLGQSKTVVPIHMGSPNELGSYSKEGPQQAYRGRLMFLCGYPSAEWLAAIGCTHLIDTEIWRRHLSFLADTPSGGFPQQPSLPSVTESTFQLPFTSIGFLGSIRHRQSPERIRRMREEAATQMTTYRRELQSGRFWNVGDSLVRRHILHDEEHFSLHQNVTIHFQRVDETKWSRTSFLPRSEKSFDDRH